MRNANKMLAVGVVGLSVLISGCYKMYFHPSASSSTSVQYQNFHHIGIFDLVEFSDPLDLQRECGERGWATFKVEKTFLAGLVGAFTQPIYGPWERGWGCK